VYNFDVIMWLCTLWLQHLRELNISDLPLLNKDQPEIYLDLRVSKPGRHVLLINYLTPVDNRSTTTVHIETRTQRGRDKGRATLYACPYTSLCRQAVTDRHGRIAVFKFDSNFINPVLKVSTFHCFSNRLEMFSHKISAYICFPK
jgi:laminin alpha 3/5